MFKYIFILILFFCMGYSCFAQTSDVAIAWNQQAGRVDYNLKRDSTVKVRVGSPRGPLYRTLVDCERRKAGFNSEKWDLHDKDGNIDFGPAKDLYFTMQTGDSLQKDRDLLVYLPGDKRAPLGSHAQFNAQNPSFLIDTAALRGTSFKVMVFVNNSLVKLIRAKALPCLVELKGTFKKGDLFTFNLWSSDHAWAAYNNFILTAVPNLISEQKVQGLSGTMAYCRQQNNYWQIFSSGIDSSNELQLTKDIGDKSCPVFSPDGKHIAFVKNSGELWVMDLHGAGQRRLASGKSVTYPRWSLDGKSILFTSVDDPYHGDSSIWELDFSSGKIREVVNRPWLQCDAAYESGGKRILFDDGPELYGRDIYAFDFKTKEAVCLTDSNGKFYNLEPASFPDGRDIVYISNPKGAYNLWIMDHFGRNPQPLTQGEFYVNNPYPAADNKSIYFLSDRDGHANVWRVNRDGSALAQVTFDKSDRKDLSIITRKSK